MNPDNRQPQPMQPQQNAPVVGQFFAPDAPIAQSTVPGAPTGTVLYGHDADSTGSAKGRRVILGLVAVVVVLGVLGFGGFFGVGALSDMHAKSTARNFVAELNRGDSSKAYTYASPDLQKKTPLALFTTVLGSLNSSKPQLSKEKISIKGTDAAYTVTESGLPIAPNGSTSGVFSISLVKHGLTGWQVDTVNIVK